MGELDGIRNSFTGQCIGMLSVLLDAAAHGTVRLAKTQIHFHDRFVESDALRVELFKNFQARQVLSAQHFFYPGLAAEEIFFGQAEMLA